MHKEEAKILLVKLQDYFDEKGFEDSELNGLELIIKKPGAGIYQLNYHGVTDQMWLSSPISGAHHFDFKDGSWISTRSPDKLHDLLDREF